MKIMMHAMNSPTFKDLFLLTTCKPITEKSQKSGVIKYKSMIMIRMMKFSSSATESWRELTLN